jgi:hypothetical protein
MLESIALTGIQNGIAAAVNAAERISVETAKGEFSAESALDLKLAIYDVKASAKVLRISREMDQTVLDIIA